MTAPAHLPKKIPHAVGGSRVYATRLYPLHRVMEVSPIWNGTHLLIKLQLVSNL